MKDLEVAEQKAEPEIELAVPAEEPHAISAEEPHAIPVEEPPSDELTQNHVPDAEVVRCGACGRDSEPAATEALALERALGAGWFFWSDGGPTLPYCPAHNPHGEGPGAQ